MKSTESYWKPDKRKLLNLGYKKAGLGTPSTALDGEMVETAGIEPASASPLPSALHAYSDFVLTGCYPPDRENRQRFRYLFSASAPNQLPSRFYESDAGMFPKEPGRIDTAPVRQQSTGY